MPRAKKKESSRETESMQNVRKFEQDFAELPKSTVEQFKAKEFDACWDACNEFLVTHPKNIGAMLYKSKISQERSKLQDAAEYMIRVIEICPLVPQFHQQLGDIYIEMKQWDLAAETFKKCLALYPNNAEVWGFTALALFMKGRKNLALMIIDHAQTVVTERKDLLFFVKGFFLENLEQDDDALLHYLQAQIESSGGENEVWAGHAYRLLTKERGEE